MPLLTCMTFTVPPMLSRSPNAIHYPNLILSLVFDPLKPSKVGAISSSVLSHTKTYPRNAFTLGAVLFMNGREANYSASSLFCARIISTNKTLITRSRLLLFTSPISKTKLILTHPLEPNSTIPSTHCTSFGISFPLNIILISVVTNKLWSKTAKYMPRLH